MAIPTIDIYVLHFDVTTAHGRKSYNDFKKNLLKMSEADHFYLNEHEEDHLGHKTIIFNQFSNRREQLIQMFEFAKINKLIEEFQVYGK